MIGTGIGLGLSEFRLPKGEFLPNSISGLVQWLDSADSTTIYQSVGGSLASSDGDPVGEWRDKSGNSRHVAQASGTNKPAFKLNIQNGKNGIFFDGVNDYLTFAMNTRPTSYTLFAVLKNAAHSSNYFFGCSNSTAGGGDVYFHFGSSLIVNGELWAWVGNGLTSSRYGRTTTSLLSLNTTTLGSAVVNVPNGINDTFSIYKNGILATVTETGNNFLGVTANNQNFSVGRLGDFTGGYFSGNLFEIIIYNSALSATHRGQVESYLNKKWGIY